MVRLLATIAVVIVLFRSGETAPSTCNDLERACQYQID